MGDITAAASLKAAMHGVSMIINLAGIIQEKRGQSFQSIHIDGTRNLITEAKAAGVKRVFLQSALGASMDSKARYQSTKAIAERIVIESGITYTIFRPSLIIGPWDGVTLKLKAIIESASPFIPVPGPGMAKFQPIYVGDWVKCVMEVIKDDSGQYDNRIIELGGPVQLSYNEIVKTLADALGVKKRLMHIPNAIARFGLKMLSRTSFSPASVEQLTLLNTDNICDVHGVRNAFGFDPKTYEEALRLFIS